MSMGVATMLYTTLAGLPSSIVTDKIQGLLTAILMVVVSLNLSFHKRNRLSMTEFADSSSLTWEGFKSMVSLFIAVTLAPLFNQSFWQRVWAAESDRVLRNGFLIGGCMAFVSMLFFGVIGIIAHANNPESYDSGGKRFSLAFFDLLAPLGQFWHVVVLILATALTASSIDSLQNGITCLLYYDLRSKGWNPIWISRGMMIAANIPAVFLSSDSYDMISFFLIADVVCVAVAFPLLLGLQRKRYGLLVAPTELGAFSGCLVGLCTVAVTGLLVGSDADLLEYFWLENGAMCAFCGRDTMITFISTPLMSIIGTYVVSAVDVMIRGDRALSPLFSLPFQAASDDEPEAAQVDQEATGVVADSTPHL